ncbi:MAG: allantoicase [Rhodospirillaceae bacterium]
MQSPLGPLHIARTDYGQADMPLPVNSLPNLASARLGAKVVSVTDDFFAKADLMLADTPPQFDPDAYDDHGKEMDGWESRRKRLPGRDHAVVRLAVPGTLELVDIDTSFFTGNYPLAAGLEGCHCAPGMDPGPETAWVPLISPIALQGDSHCLGTIVHPEPVSHVRLTQFPDGGIARLRLYGLPAPAPHQGGDGPVNLASVLAGGRILGVSNRHYGTPWPILYPDAPANMGDGWETARRRAPGFEWILIGLGQAGHVQRIELETTHFKGNYPKLVSVSAAPLDPALMALPGAAIAAESLHWTEILPKTATGPDGQFGFDIAPGTETQILRLDLHPDGGVARLRVFAEPLPPAASSL